ncbi:hypothetical protein, partial [Bacteroides xylanisolvens]|uniref:hypothetical protein n=1 Tax=Bacteroides xylanisolvens TaxID=371601 RepID=UPI0034A1CAA4
FLRFFVSLPCVFIFNYPRFGRQTVFWGECLKIQKRQLTRNELVALNFIILGISQNNEIYQIRNSAPY